MDKYCQMSPPGDWKTHLYTFMWKVVNYHELYNIKIDQLLELLPINRLFFHNRLCLTVIGSSITPHSVMREWISFQIKKLQQGCDWNIKSNWFKTLWANINFTRSMQSLPQSDRVTSATKISLKFFYYKNLLPFASNIAVCRHKPIIHKSLSLANLLRKTTKSR